MAEKGKRARVSTVNSYYCPHCNKDVSKSTWYLHHNQFFDPVTKSWRRDVNTGGGQKEEYDFDFGPESSASEDSDLEMHTETEENLGLELHAAAFVSDHTCNYHWIVLSIIIIE